MIFKCPGQDKRNIQAKVLKCPECGYEIELFSDEIKANCPRCRKEVCVDNLPSCIDWCRHAKECVGQPAYEKHSKDKSQLLKDKLIRGLEEYFGKDAKRINHAKKVMGFAEELLRFESGDWHIVIPASILHDVGIKTAEEKYRSSAGGHQEKEGPEIAAGILRKSGCKKEDISEICEIIAHHHSPGKVDTQNFKVLYDADCLVNLRGEVAGKDKNRIEALIEKVFLTKSGKELAQKTYL